MHAFLSRPQLFLKCNPNDMRTNGFMIHGANAWYANIDMQYIYFIMDPYGAAVYVASYM